ncbi:MAG: hypothetical protein OXT49_09285 [Gammaproteobacteria bacterium]|nr:hypothetical protein [Gammaproteobacteria bacterium]
MKTRILIPTVFLFSLGLTACATPGGQDTAEARQAYENEKYYHPNCTHLPEGSATQKQCWADENYKERKARERQHNRELLKQQQEELQEIRSLGDRKNLGL